MVLFHEGNADVAGTLARLAEIAVVHADAGADLLMPSGMLDGSVAALRTAARVGAARVVPVAAMASSRAARTRRTGVRSRRCR